MLSSEQMSHIMSSEKMSHIMSSTSTKHSVMVTKMPMPCVNVGNCNRDTCPYQHVVEDSIKDEEEVNDHDYRLQLALSKSLEVPCSNCRKVFYSQDEMCLHQMDCLDEHIEEPQQQQKQQPPPKKRKRNSSSEQQQLHRRSSRSVKAPSHLAAYELTAKSAGTEQLEVSNSHRHRVLIEDGESDDVGNDSETDDEIEIVAAIVTLSLQEEMNMAADSTCNQSHLANRHKT